MSPETLTLALMIATAVYMLFLVTLNTENLLSVVLFKLPPLVLGLAWAFKSLSEIGWI